MDGVIFEGRNFWLDLHRAMGTEREAWRLWHAYGKNDYRHLGKMTVEQLWIRRSAGAFYELIASRTYVHGAAKVIRWLRQHAVRSAIVSSGPYQLAERAQRELGVDVIRANRVAISDTCFTGEVDIQVDDSRKELAAVAVMNELGMQPACTAMVSDNAGDSRLAGVVGRLIAYDPESPELAAAADTVIPSGHLPDLIRLLERQRYSDG
jgi:phosphoserine phosphatase